MADTPEFTQANLIALDQAIASGANRVKFADREMQYNSLSDMIKARNLILQYLNDQSGGANNTRRQLRVYTGSGW